MSDDIFRSVGGVPYYAASPPWQFGWVPRPVHERLMLAARVGPLFEQAGRACMYASADDRDALLWEATVRVTGAHLPAHRQSIGSCTSQGWSSGVDYLQCIEIALKGEPEEYKPISHAVFYGLGRERAGMLGSGDGCYGSAMAEAAVKDGCVSNEDAQDSGTDDRLAGEYGRRGVPAALKALAKQHLVKTAALVKTAEECRAALQSGYPVPVCSGQGFSMERNAEGYCRPQGSWAHCMLICGYRSDKKWFCILQSWGQNTPSGPCTLGQPDCSFWTDWDTVDKMLRGEDSFAISAFDGFIPRDLTWLI